MTPNRSPRRRISTVMFAILLLFIAPILARAALYAVSDDPRSWRDADWSSTGLLPAPREFEPARVIIFTGTAGAWKGRLGPTNPAQQLAGRRKMARQ